MSRSAASVASAQSGQTTEVEHPHDAIELTEQKLDAGETPETEGPRPGAAGPGGPGHLYQPKSLKFWLVIVSNFLALFLVALDRTIVATAIPRITDEFKSLGDIGWYGSAYMLTSSASQLLFGRIYKFYDMKWTFLVCVVVFEVGSVVCGAAPSSTAFIVGRAVAGAASAGIFSGCMLIMIPMVPLHKRPVFQGMFGMVFGLSSVLGPVIGGAFTGHVSWRWCFYINLPVGAVSVGFLILFWNPPAQTHAPAPLKEHVQRLDPLGSLFYLPAVTCLLLALQWGGSAYAWGSGRIVALFVLFGALAAAFVAVQVLLPATATVPPRVVTQRSVLCAALFTFFLAGSMLMCIYYVPVWFQTAKGVGPLDSGVYTIPLVLSLAAASLLSGVGTQKAGYYVPAMLLSPGVTAAGGGLMSTWRPGTGPPRWIGYQFVAGFGLGLGVQTGGLAIQTVLPAPDVSTGIALVFFAQQLGGAVSTTVAQTILGNLLAARLRGVPGVDAAALVDSGATDLLGAVPPGALGAVVAAYNYACTRVFLAAMGLALAALLAALGMEWRSIKQGRNGQPGGPGGPGGPAGPGALEAGQAGRGGAEEGVARKARACIAGGGGGAASGSERPVRRGRQV